MLILDFDGVVADALTECAGVTWYAGRLQRGAYVPRLPGALEAVPAGFIRTFGQVRPHCRTLDDFMLTNFVAEKGRDVEKTVFEDLRLRYKEELQSQAALAEDVRAAWRQKDHRAWLDLHDIYPGLARLILESGQEIAIVSAKDSASIREILRHHGLDQGVSAIRGSCKDKAKEISELLEQSGEGRATFIDDSIANILAMRDLPVTALWAAWGYHTRADIDLAVENGVRMLHLSDLEMFYNSTP